MSIRTAEQKANRIKAYKIAQDIALGISCSSEPLSDEVYIEVEKYLSGFQYNCKRFLNSLYN